MGKICTETKFNFFTATASLNTLYVFLADGPALGTQEFSFTRGPDSGARDGQESTELSHRPRSRRPLQGGVRERRFLAVTSN